MPLLFIGHGSPMNAIEDNRWSRGFKELATLLPRPRVVLAVSAHWFTPGTFLTANEIPRTIHDFSGFPEELFRTEYSAPGDLGLAKRVVELLGEKASLSEEWGLDHGTWSVLRYLLPEADVPVVQLSIDYKLAPEGHLELGSKLKDLRDEGVLIIGSGNIVHNLRHALTNMKQGVTNTPRWAEIFDTEVAKACEELDGAYLCKAATSDAGRISHPTLDHYLPLLYTVGAADKDDVVTFPITGFDASSLSMRSVLIGAA